MPTTDENKRRRPPKLRQILDLYDAFLRDGEVQKVAAALGLRTRSVNYMLATHKEFRYARKLAEERRGDRSSLSNYIYKHLSPEAQEIWKKIQYYQSKKDATWDKIDTMLSGKSRRIRQEIFINALIHSSFDLSEACKMAGVSRRLLEEWRREDLHFMQLMEEVQWHKKNFFEHALVDLVEMRHPGATVFVNRTLNADRGYNERIQLEHSGSPEMHGYRVEDLDLDIETRKKVLQAIRQKKEEAEQETKSIKAPAIDV